jgi:hypothetical protein
MRSPARRRSTIAGRGPERDEMRFIDHAGSMLAMFQAAD